MNLHSYSTLYAQFASDTRLIVDFLRWLTGAYHFPQDLHILDIGCGTGQMLCEFHNLGWRTSGMEPDPDFFQSAVNLNLPPEVTLDKAGFLDLDVENQIDLITAINDPFAYLGEYDDRIAALGRMYRALRPGGLLFLEVTNFLFKLWRYVPSTTETRCIEGVKVTHNMYHELDFGKGQWIHHDEFVVDGGTERLQKTHRLSIISVPELLHLIRQQGFVDIQTFNSYEARTPAEPNGKVILVSARKPALLTLTQARPAAADIP